MADKLSIVRMIGSSAHSAEDRQPDDFYATDPVALHLFLRALDRDRIKLDTNIWECACGNGVLSLELSQQGYRVFSTDIVQRRDAASMLIDFVNDPLPRWEGDILTNPPYKYANEFLLRALDCILEENLVVLFLRLQFLEGIKRRELFKIAPPRWVYIHSARVHTFKNGDLKYAKSSSAVCFAWFVWQKGYQGEPTIRWIDR